MKIEEEWWSAALKKDYVEVTHTLNTRVCISTQRWLKAKMELR